MPRLLPSALVFLTACTPSEDAFFDELAESFCERLVQCDIDLGYGSVEDCIETFLDGVDEDALEDCAYDEDEAEECLDAVQQAECDDSGAAILEALAEDCDHVWDCSETDTDTDTDADTDTDTDADTDTDTDTDTDADVDIGITAVSYDCRSNEWEYEARLGGRGVAVTLDIYQNEGGYAWEEHHELEPRDHDPGGAWDEWGILLPMVEDWRDQQDSVNTLFFECSFEPTMTWMIQAWYTGGSYADCVVWGKDVSYYDAYGCREIDP
ncbi:MAG: hypothetical protein JXB39_08335 [Deltaproteobacteria bacterium]|nr:hypothetical protein [Deltaproteobacteria bacterium]